MDNATSTTSAAVNPSTTTSPLPECSVQRSYENPNYRKLYAKLSMDSMIGGGTSTTTNGAELNETKLTKDPTEIRPDGQIPTEEDADDLQFFYDEYEEDDDEEDEEDEEEYFEDDYMSSPTVDTVPKSLNPPTTTKQLVESQLPDGWEQHEDELGSYFWHIPTGTIQRDKPYLDTIDKSMIRSDSLVFLDKSAINVDYNPADSSIEEEDVEKTRTVKEHDHSEQEDEDEDERERKSLLSKKKVIANLRLTFPTDSEGDLEELDEDDEHHHHHQPDNKKLNFLVHSLGWLEVDESQINPQTGSMVIKRCIQQLSSGRGGGKSREMAARCWGPNETQSLILRLGGEKLCLLDPTTETVLSIQLIREIRMWAVDEQNYFAYVVKDRGGSSSSSGASPQGPRSPVPHQLKCHVFHCEDYVQNGHSVAGGSKQPAQRIALYLKDALIRIKNKAEGEGKSRPGKLAFGPNGSVDSFEFPTPIEEPRKTLPAMYIGLVPVPKPMGVDVLNMAIDEIVASLKLSLSDESDETELMRRVNVHVSPSTIVVECADTGATLLECRVRYLSFLSISLDNVKRCGFIMQVDERKFVAHCFQADPSAGALCKTIEAACKLRYQKCLDAHTRLAKSRAEQAAAQQHSRAQSQGETSNGKQNSPVADAIKSTIVGLFSKIRGK